MWLRVHAVVFALVMMLTTPVQAAELSRGSPLRAAILNALRPRVEADIGEAVKFNVSVINVEGNLAFLSVTPVQADGRAIDWSHTRFAKAFAADAMSDVVLALLQRKNNGWQIAEYAFGPTDVAWEEWIPKYHLKRSFFLGESSPVQPQTGAATPPPPVDDRTAPIELLKVRIDEDCTALDLARWSHPVRDVIEQRKGVRLRWAALCQNRRYPIFGLDFDFDPQGQTDDFFHPLFNDILQANGRWPYSIVDGRDELMINITSKGKTALNIEYREAPEFSGQPAAPPAAQSETPNAGSDTDSATAAPLPEKTPPPAPGGPSPDELKRDAAFKNYTAALASLAAYEKSDDVAQWQKGLEEAEQATVLDPEPGDYWRALGYAYSIVASIDTTASALAEDALNKALARNAQDTAAHLILARLQLARAAFAPALDHMEAVISLKPELADSALVAEMCRAYLADGLGQRGETFFSTRLQATPKANPLRLGKAILLGERQQFTEALPLAQSVADDPKATQEDANKARELITAWKGSTP